MFVRWHTGSLDENRDRPLTIVRPRHASLFPEQAPPQYLSRKCIFDHPTEGQSPAHREVSATSRAVSREGSRSRGD